MLSVSFLMAVISPPSCFSLQSSSRGNDASTLFSMLASPLPPSFVDTYSLSTASLGCSALCMVINFLVLWSICLSISLNHFRKGPEYYHYYYYYYCLLSLFTPALAHGFSLEFEW